MLNVTINAQPDGVSCGPTCLHAIYRYYANAISLDQTIADAPCLKTGGTLAVLLGCDALKRGYLDKNVPLLSGISATWLYQNMRDYTSEHDQVVYDE